MITTTFYGPKHNPAPLTHSRTGQTVNVINTDGGLIEVVIIGGPNNERSFWCEQTELEPQRG